MRFVNRYNDTILFVGLAHRKKGDRLSDFSNFYSPH
jgi:hypothetical protein